MSAEIQNVLKKYKEFVSDIMTSKDYLAFDVLNNVAAAYFELGETIKAEKYLEHILANIKPTAAILHRYILQHTDCQKFTDRFTVMTCP